MKPELINEIAEDRPATYEEIRRATSGTPDRLLELCRTAGTHCEIGSESGAIVRYPAEEFELFACLSETEKTLIN